jgi:hypothetical protein
MSPAVEMKILKTVLNRHADAAFDRNQLATPLNYSRASAQAVCKIL